MRRPRFALVLVAIGIPIVALLAIGRRQSSQPKPAPDRPARACVTTRARAQTTLDKAVRVRARVSYPIAVTERARHGLSIVTVTRSATIVEVARVDRPLKVTADAVIPGRACATGTSKTAARTLALQRAQQSALAGARKQSRAAAARRARELARSLQLAQLAQARKPPLPGRKRSPLR
jgi:hypothetical protein